MKSKMENYNFIKRDAGFTLIELLIVIAIIGILAAVLIPNLLSARAKATDARIKSQIKSIQSQALLYYEVDNTYGNSPNNGSSSVCNHTTTQDMLNYVTNTIGPVTIDGYDPTISSNNPFPIPPVTVPTVLCYYRVDEYAVLSPLASDDTQAFCADSTGFAGLVAFDAMIDSKCNN